jgi:hypothetical protein
MESAGPSETLSTFYQTARRHILEDNGLKLLGQLQDVTSLFMTSHLILVEFEQGMVQSSVLAMGNCCRF